MGIQIGGMSGGGGGAGGDALTTNPLSQFAATTSAQLAGVISDETGSGASVFAASPTLTGSPILGTPSATSLTINSSVLIGGAATYSIEQRAGTNAQTYRLYETYTDASNYSRLSISAPAGGPITFASEAVGTGAARSFEFSRAVYVGTGGAGAYLVCQYIAFATGSTTLLSPSNGVITLSNGGLSDFNRLQFGGTTSSFPSHKRSGTAIQGRLADDSAFCTIQGILKTDANAVTGLTAGVLAATTNATITITDASGQVYRVPCII